MHSSEKRAYPVQRLTDRLLQFDDPITATCYLLLGDEKNLLIDTGSGEPEEFRQLLLPYRDKPLVLAITHAHADHYANAGIPGLFTAAYMHPKDIAILPEMNDYFVFAMAEQGRAVLPEMLTPLREDQDFDLGGVHVRTLPLPGHSPGSVCFHVPELNMLFTGDAVGSGEEFWMQLPQCLTLKEYVGHLERFLDALPSPEVKLMGGHSCQAGIPGQPGYHPMNYDAIRELAEVCRRLVAGDNTLNVFKPEAEHLDDGVRKVIYQQTQMLFRPNRIR